MINVADMLFDETKSFVQRGRLPVFKTLSEQCEAPSADATLLEMVKRCVDGCGANIEVFLAILNGLFQDAHVLGIDLISRHFVLGRVPHRDIQPKSDLMSQEQKQNKKRRNLMRRSSSKHIE